MHYCNWGCSTFGDKCLLMGTNASCKWQKISCKAWDLSVIGGSPWCRAIFHLKPNLNVWNPQRQGCCWLCRMLSDILMIIRKHVWCIFSIFSIDRIRRNSPKSPTPSHESGEFLWGIPSCPGEGRKRITQNWGTKPGHNSQVLLHLRQWPTASFS